MRKHPICVLLLGAAVAALPFSAATAELRASKSFPKIAAGKNVPMPKPRRGSWDSYTCEDPVGCITEDGDGGLQRTCTFVYSNPDQTITLTGPCKAVLG
jgi:hypothetical protein